MLFLENQPLFISSAYNASPCASWVRVVLGIISSILMMLPSAAMKAMLKGSGVFFIQNLYRSAFSNTKSIPQLPHKWSRCINPRSRLCWVSAISARTVCDPIFRKVSSAQATGKKQARQSSRVVWIIFMVCIVYQDVDLSGCPPDGLQSHPIFDLIS